MNKAIFITVTDTGVGKTIICAGLALAFRKKGIDVGVMKPISTGAIRRKNGFNSLDVEFLKKAAQIKDQPHLVNPYCIDLPLAPIAAFKNISVSKIRDCFSKLINQFISSSLH